MRFLRHQRDAARGSRRLAAAEAADRFETGRRPPTASACRASILSSVVLPGAVRPEDAHQIARRDRQRHIVHHEGPRRDRQTRRDQRATLSAVAPGNGSARPSDRQGGLLPAFSAPKTLGRPRRSGFLTRGVKSAAHAFPSRSLSGGSRAQERAGDRAKRSRLQWRDRVGIAPTSRNRRGHHRLTRRPAAAGPEEPEYSRVASACCFFVTLRCSCPKAGPDVTGPKPKGNA